MSVRPAVQNLPPYRFKAQPYTVKLDQNESPYDLPPALKERAIQRIAQLPFNRYPEMQGESLRAALASYHGWPEAGTVLGGGSNVLIQAFVTACGLGQTVLSVAPTFAVYGMQAQLMGAELVEVPLADGFALPTEALKAELVRGRGVFFLANPAAPTGNTFDEGELRELIESAAPGWTVVLDEAYCQFARNDLLSLVRDYPHVASLRTFSKAFGLGGVRLGYALAGSELAEQIRKVPLPFSVSALQLAVGLTVLESPGYVEERVSEVERERERIYAALCELEHIQVFPSKTNFLLFKTPDAGTFFDGLLKHGVLIRRQDHLSGLDGCLRVSVGIPQENDAFLHAMMQVHANYSEEAVRG